MAGPDRKMIAAVEAYFTDLRQVRASGGATGERSYYPALASLIGVVGRTLKPRVFCVLEAADQGAGHPDYALYTARQVQKGRPREGQVPERGVVEVKGVGEDAWLTAESDQVSRYWGHYRLVLVTNMRDFVLVGADGSGSAAKLEHFRLAEDANDFWTKVEKPRAFAREVGAGLGEYLARALSHRATLTEPKDLAWVLASYARDGLSRVEAAGRPASLMTLRSALEETLGIRFKGKRGERFFRSTLIQTLFYGIFSAWVLWSRDELGKDGPPFEAGHGPRRFRWRLAVWHLRAPVLRALFGQLSDPGRLKPLGLVEVLDWASAALNRVDRAAFFARFNEGDAVPYFYEPFLEAFDPALRKQLGVWYTPSEVVRYMVARVDKALKNDLGISEGLAAENVYVLDPCCGTGAYLAEVLRRIAKNLEGHGLGALAGQAVRKAATERVFGFEIMPAPFVVAHLQVGLTMQNLDAPLAANGSERAGVFLTNALTGWEPHMTKPLPFPELEEERDQADRVKQDTPILVILGNPPYNGFAGMAVDEERELSEAYRTTKRVRRPEGQGLNDLYVRFFRMAERRIAVRTGQGVVCFISNYSWLDGLSFTGMRERYLEAFDAIRIDCLNGDKYKTGKVAPDGSPDPSIFSTEGDPVGIQVGTAIATLVRKADHEPVRSVGFRNLWGQEKPEELIATAEGEPDSLYSEIEPVLPLGLPFVDTAVSEDWFDWPALPELFPVSFPGVQTGRDAFLVDTDLDRLQTRVGNYFDPALSHQEIAQRYPRVMKSTARFDARAVREGLLKRGDSDESGFVPFAYRPFDNRWLYWEKDTKLLDEKRADYRPHAFEGNLWLSAAQHLRKGVDEPQTYPTDYLGSRHLIERGALMFPAWLREGGLGYDADTGRRTNLSAAAERYLTCLGLGVQDLFHHVLATLHDPTYRQDNEGALRVEWPRIPLPGWPDGDTEGATEKLAQSAAHGRKLAALLDPETPVPGVTRPPLRPEIAAIAVPCTVAGRNMTGEDFAVTAGWGHSGAGDAVMPGRGRIVERSYAPEETAAMRDAADVLGDRSLDVYLNGEAFWRNIPSPVWDYRLGGYQVLKKWLSYREQKVLGRRLRAEEVQHFADTARRIGALLMAQAGGVGGYTTWPDLDSGRSNVITT
ncbi:MAG: N-6 DNA methylase [Gemmatimonadetes bacterium]|nr:N-6 DNA methylase [Gemmatimonadota bacterium]MYB99024.1 N-6 DNA methylase [Gemmatimonadota bacterium]MYI46932.1 N-6 DNA methylase [Gemmatimonadota bacterium]